MTKKEFLQQIVIALAGNPSIVSAEYKTRYCVNLLHEMAHSILDRFTTDAELTQEPPAQG